MLEDKSLCSTEWFFFLTHRWCKQTEHLVLSELSYDAITAPLCELTRKAGSQSEDLWNPQDIKEAVRRFVWLLFSRCVPAAHNEHQSGVVRVRVVPSVALMYAEAWCRIRSFQDGLNGTWRKCEAMGSVGAMVHSPELTSGERELVPGKQQSTSKKAQRVFAQRSVYLAEISSSPSPSPLASGRAGVYQRRTVKGFERFSTLPFSAPPPPFESMGVSETVGQQMQMM